MTSIQVRDAVDHDIVTITDIFNQAIPDGNAEWTEHLHPVEERRGWWQARVSSGRPVLVAVRDDAVIGVASYGDFRDSTCREGFRFTAEHSVYLDRSAKGSGAADLLMDELEERARAAGIRMMLATIDGSNEASIRFHARRGYVETGRLPAVGFTFDTWRDFIIMQLDLTGSDLQT
ncbi:MAG: GNAT family N-acetyltransferase [Ilumatobacter sp.]|uniref:GNAT family N-acetyltransferase n=1 Tax=Ilumatobacter sp. TaxID=1967498 RepID=UPI00391C4399